MKQEFRIGTGASSLMMLFVILTLTTLGVLAFTTATADWRMTDKSARMTEDWYAAAAQAQAALAELDAYLAQGNEKDDFDTALGDVESTDTGLLCSFDAGGGRRLLVDVAIAPSAQSPRFRVVSHTLASADTWSDDTLLDVFKGD